MFLYTFTKSIMQSIQFKGEYYIGQEMADFLSKLHFVPVSQDCPAKKSQDTGFCNMVTTPTPLPLVHRTKWPHVLFSGD
jgi:hypothetical protein